MGHINAAELVETTVDTATGHSAEEIADAVRAAFAGDKTAIWKALKRTDPKATKPFQRAGGFRGTQIDPAWRLQMMTEVFGPVGKGWGFEQLEWTIAERMVFICARVWIADPVTGEKYYTGPQWGGTELVRKSRDGSERPDDESFKMSMTDAIGKCFLQLGLAADIYLGMFDDSKYREDSEAIYAAKSNGWNELSVAKFERDIKKELAEVIDMDALNDLWSNKAAAPMKEIKAAYQKTWQVIFDAFANQKKEILSRTEEVTQQVPDEAGDDSADKEPSEDQAQEPSEKTALDAAVELEVGLKADIAAVEDLEQLDDVYRANIEAIKGSKDANKRAHDNILAAFKTRKAELLKSEAKASQDPNANPADTIDSPWTIDVPKMPDGSYAWEAFVTEMLRVIATIPNDDWGGKFVALHKVQVAALGKVAGTIRNVNGNLQTGKEAAQEIRSAMQRRFDELAPPQVAAE